MPGILATQLHAHPHQQHWCICNYRNHKPPLQICFPKEGKLCSSCTSIWRSEPAAEERVCIRSQVWVRIVSNQSNRLETAENSVSRWREPAQSRSMGQQHPSPPWPVSGSRLFPPLFYASLLLAVRTATLSPRICSNPNSDPPPPSTFRFNPFPESRFCTAPRSELTHAWKAKRYRALMAPPTTLQPCTTPWSLPGARGTPHTPRRGWTRTPLPSAHTAPRWRHLPHLPPPQGRPLVTWHTPPPHGQGRRRTRGWGRSSRRWEAADVGCGSGLPRAALCRDALGSGAGMLSSRHGKARVTCWLPARWTPAAAAARQKHWSSPCPITPPELGVSRSYVHEWQKSMDGNYLQPLKDWCLMTRITQ